MYTFEDFSRDIINSIERNKTDIDKIFLDIADCNEKLLLKSRNWKKTADILNKYLPKDLYKNYSGEEVRQKVKYIKKKLRETNNLKECVQNNIQYTDENRDEYIEKTKYRNILNDYRKLLRDEARVQTFKEDIIKAINNLPPLKVDKEVKDINKDKCDSEAILMLSDLHIGVKCDNFYNKFNLNIAKNRCKKLVSDVRNYCLREKVKVLHIVNLGDMIHGIIHTNARIEQEMDITQQIINASELISNIINELSTCAPIVNYRSCLDNHSRIIANLREHIEVESFSKLIDWYVEERLKNSKVKFIHDNIDDGIGMFNLELNDKKVVFAHGHQDPTNSALQHFIGITEEFIHYVLLAHEHSEKVKVYQNVRVITNGSIVGTEQYALSKRLFNKPSQTLLIFNKDNLLNISINLDINE